MGSGEVRENRPLRLAIKIGEPLLFIRFEALPLFAALCNEFLNVPFNIGAFISMSHSVKIYDTCIGCTQCVRACPTDVLEMVPWDGCKAGQIAASPRTEDCVGCKRCETACPTDFLSVRVYLGAETTRSMGLAY